MNERYYKVYFNNDGTDMTLFENQFLNSNKYTYTSDNPYDFTDVVYEEKKLNPKFDFLDVSFYYDGYKLTSVNCYYSNDCKKDGFKYDRRNQRIIYGKTPIYAKLEGDCFIDIVTGIVIPKTIITKVIEIDSSQQLNIMANDLIKLSKYVSVYSIILNDWISMLSADFINKKTVEDIYAELCIEKYNQLHKELDLCLCDYEDLQKEIGDDATLKIGEYHKIKKIVDNIRKKF